MNDPSTPRRAGVPARGFSFIEILVVMAIISVLVTSVVVLVPGVVRQAHRMKSIANLRTITELMLSHKRSQSQGEIQDDALMFRGWTWAHEAHLSVDNFVALFRFGKG